jgi:hypothetical protein
MFAPALPSSRLRLAYALTFALGCLATAAFADEQSPAPAASPTPLTPEKIYLRAIRAMKDAPQPPFITFREHVVGRNFTLRCTGDGMNVSLHHGDVTATYDVWFRTSDGSALSEPVGVASAKPCPATLLIPAGSAVSSLGVPQASPSPGTAPSTASADSQIGPPIIAEVHVDGAFYYHIDLAGVEKLGPNDVYHLKLKAYRDPDKHPLTDLYVDPQTFLVREARGEVSGHFVIGSGRFAGVVDFDRVGEYWLVEREQFEIAANALLVHARMMATIDGSNFATPNELPGIAFPTPQPTPAPRATSSSSR